VRAFENLTGHAVAKTIGHDPEGHWRVTAIVKATFTWEGDGAAVPTTPVPIDEDDQLVEMGPPRPRTDVLLVGTMAFPSPMTEIDTCLEVGTRIRKIVRVFGDRVWLPRAFGGAGPSDPLPATTVPITWERCFGGTDADDPRLIERRNPVGSGIATRIESLQGRPAPSFEDPGDLIATWKSRPAPIGFGPIAAHWVPRIAFAGTYDDVWEKERSPFLPHDFDPAFFNVAPTDQQLDGYRFGEQVALTNMTSAAYDRFRLPPFEVPVEFVTREDLVEDEAVVDTIIIEPAERRFSLIARANARLRSGAASLRRIVVGGHSRAADPLRENAAGAPP